MSKSMIISGISIFILLVIAVIGLSYCSVYKNRNQELAANIVSANNENEDLVNQINSLQKQLETTSSKLKAKTTEAEMLESALSDLRKQMGKVTAEKQEIEQEKLSLEELTSSLKQEIESKEIKITELEGRLTVNLMDKVLFDSGRAEIKESGREVLNKISKNLLNKYPDRAILVEGHTDNVPIGSDLKSKFPTNWELSTARATAAVRYLQDKGQVDPERLAAVGYSEYHPISSNDIPEGRAKNRRIEIILLPPDSPLAKK
ncbi:OmpA family protein [Candidatus Poribacteria bacterium]|nr:OmpA family protein [Candidatus Poribacteria bacterium]